MRGTASFIGEVNRLRAEKKEWLLKEEEMRNDLEMAYDDINHYMGLLDEVERLATTPGVTWQVIVIAIREVVEKYTGIVRSEASDS